MSDLAAWIPADVARVGGIAGVIGEKAAGIAALPQAWTPPWAVLRAPQAGWRPAREACGAVLRAAPRWVLVRSNGPAERSRPAQGRSRVVPSSAVDKVLDVAAEEVASGQWPIVQVAVEPALLGVMSNERRLTRDATRWRVEAPLELTSPKNTQIESVEQATLDEGLQADSSERLPAALAHLGWRLNERFADERVRCEWAWDGRRVWVLQADTQPHTSAGAADAWLAEPPRAWATPHHPAPPVPPGGWTKHQSLRLFERLGWPTLPTVSIPGTRAHDREIRRALADAGLEVSDARPVSIRTDTRGAHRVLLPTSGPCRSVAQVLRFVARAAPILDAAGLSVEDRTFLIAPWVDAHTGAWAWANYAHQRVVIDAIWGHPDGLGSLPHDRFSVEPDSGTVRELVRHKPLLLRGDGERPRYESIGKPWDWRASLSRAQALRIAEWAALLAGELGGDIKLLVLAAVNGRDGADALLPLLQLPATVRGVLRQHVLSPRVITSAEDARTLEPGTAAVTLRLPAGRVRDVSELREIAAACRAAQVPILVQGSELGHTPYVLRAAGAEAISAGHDETADGEDGRWITCLLRRERSFARILALPATDVLALLDASLRAAESAHNRTDVSLARQSRARYDAITHGTKPIRLSELPVLDERLAGAIEGLATDTRGQPFVDLA